MAAPDPPQARDASGESSAPSPAARTDAYLARAAASHGLASYYIDCVRPLLRGGPAPRCCGGGCEPCNQVLAAVAEQVLAWEEEDKRREGPPKDDPPTAP